MSPHSHHSLANIFPLLHSGEFATLAEDIRASGLHEPIVLFEGAILDGRNRHRACLEAGVEPEFKDFEGPVPLAFVLPLNLMRRHLNDGQRAMVAAKIANMRQGARTDLQPSANLPEVSQTQAAKRLNVSERSVRSAVEVRERPVVVEIKRRRPKAYRRRRHISPALRRITQGTNIMTQDQAIDFKFKSFPSLRWDDLSYWKCDVCDKGSREQFFCISTSQEGLRVCEKCLKDGRGQIDAQLQKRAEEIEAELATYRSLIGRPMNLPTYKAWETAKAASGEMLAEEADAELDAKYKAAHERDAAKRERDAAKFSSKVRRFFYALKAITRPATDDGIPF